MQPPLSPADLVRLVIGAGETPGVDAKAPMAWDGGEASANLTKDILACSNHRDGGALVIGKKQLGVGFELTGLSASEAASFETTRVADFVNARCDPPVRLTCYPIDHQGHTLVVIHVAEFDEIPTVCTRTEGQKGSGARPILEAGRLYVRRPNASSSTIISADDLRPLIGIATKKRRDELVAYIDAAMQGRSLDRGPSHEELYRRDADTIRTFLDRSMSDAWAAGCWRFAFWPSAYSATRFTDRKSLRESVAAATVRRRVSFPPSYNLQVQNWGVCAFDDDAGFGMVLSGLFFGAVVFRENTQEFTSPWVSLTHPRDPPLAPGTWLDFETVIYDVGSFFLFLARFASRWSGEEIEYSVQASRLKGRRLVTRNARINYEPTQPCSADEFSVTGRLNADTVQTAWTGECARVLAEFTQFFPEGELEPSAFLPHLVSNFGGAS